MNHCSRCRCSLDVGDEAPTSTDQRPLCVSCDLILKGFDPFVAMQRAAAVKEAAIAEIGGAA